MTVEDDPFRSTDVRPEASVIRFQDLDARKRERTDTGRNFDHQVWEYDFPDSKWFNHGELMRLDPGEYTAFRSHREGIDGALETCLRVVSGCAVLRTESRDELLERFDFIAVPVGAAYQIGNVGTEPLWVAAWTSAGDIDAVDTKKSDSADGHREREEYGRIMAMRETNDLPTFPGYDGEYADGPGEDRPEPMVTRFVETIPKVFHEAPAVGCNADRPDWVITLSEVDWFSDSVVMKLEPGEYTSLHTHFDNEGPHEEIYWVIEGTGRLLTEYRDTTLHRFDCAFFPTGTPHSVGNVGTDTMWVAAWGARGGVEGEFDLSDLEVLERPGQVEEYERVMAAREKRGLPIPPNATVNQE